MRATNNLSSEKIAAMASLINAAVNARFPKLRFDIEEIPLEQKERRRRLRGMTARLHETWESLENERRSAACRFEWARLQIFLALEVLPILQHEKELFLVKLADENWRVLPHEATAGMLLGPNREVHQAIYRLREQGFSPRCVVTYAVTGDFDEKYKHTLQPRAYVLVSGAPHSAIDIAFQGIRAGSPRGSGNRVKITPIPIWDCGRALGYLARMKCEDWDHSTFSKRLFYWSEMLREDERVWLRIMAVLPMTHMVDFIGFAEPFRWRFMHETVASLLAVLEADEVQPGKGQYGLGDVTSA